MGEADQQNGSLGAMSMYTKSWLKVAVLGLASTVLLACGQTNTWEADWSAGVKAHHQGNLVQAEQLLSGATAQAEQFGRATCGWPRA